MTLDPSITAALISTAGAWTWDAVGKPLAAKLRGEAADKADTFDWKEAERAYRESLAEQHATIRILGKPDPVSLTEIFTDVNILNRPAALARYDIRKLREQEFDRFDRYLDTGRRQERVPGPELVKRGRNLYILGKPGAGKTTFLRYLTLQCLKGELDHTPIFVSLKEWSTSDHADLLAFIVDQFAICNFPGAQPFVEELLKSGNALVLFDGLDEVVKEGDQRAETVRLLQNFAKQHRKAQVLITCRIAASEYAFQGFSEVEVADFTRGQIHAYAHSWFGEDKEKRETFIADLYKDQNEGIRELCATPLLLAMLCLAFDETGYFAERRSDLYGDALEALLRKWDASRSIRRDEIYRGLSPQRRMQLLSHVAAQNFERGDYFMERRHLADQIADYLANLPSAPARADIDGDAVLRAISAQHGILVEWARDIYAFSHLTFQEYLTALFVVSNEANGITSRMTHRHLAERRWREVFLLVSSLLVDADSFVTELRRTVDALIIEDPVIVALFTWMDERTTSNNTPDERRSSVRLAYYYLALNGDRVRELSTERVLERVVEIDSVFERDIAVARERSYARAIERALAFNKSNAVAQERKRALDIERSLSLDLAFAIETEIALGFDYEINYRWTIACSLAGLVSTDKFTPQRRSYGMSFPALIQMAADADLPTVVERLSLLTLPGGQARQAVWQAFADQLLIIMQEERDLGRAWNLSRKQLDRLNTYFAANELLVKCLELAYVSDRQAILNGLLAPPVRA